MARRSASTRAEQSQSLGKDSVPTHAVRRANAPLAAGCGGRRPPPQSCRRTGTRLYRAQDPSGRLPPPPAGYTLSTSTRTTANAWLPSPASDRRTPSPWPARPYSLRGGRQGPSSRRCWADRAPTAPSVLQLSPQHRALSRNRPGHRSRHTLQPLGRRRRRFRPVRLPRPHDSRPARRATASHGTISWQYVRSHSSTAAGAGRTPSVSKNELVLMGPMRHRYPYPGRPD